MTDPSQRLTRIAVFYDGNYFLHVSNYYAYHHKRRSRISIAGLHDFIRHKVGELESTDYELCQIVDAHYFRGRLSAQDASNEGNRLYYDRLFDDILMMEGVTTHYLPVRNIGGVRQERGIDVWLALEAFEMAVLKKYNVVAIIASDGDYVPLMRKLNTLGTRVMLLSWDYEFYDEEGRRKSTITSQYLWNAATYPMAMHEFIESPHDYEVEQINNLFHERKKTIIPEGDIQEGETIRSSIYSLKDGYGFVLYPQTNNLFFHYTFLVDTDFNDLREGDPVEFTLSKNDRGEPIARNVRLIRN
ncbi:MAG: NYN domain-containing protein [Saprospiraceae bacterium]